MIVYKYSMSIKLNIDFTHTHILYIYCTALYTLYMHVHCTFTILKRQTDGIYYTCMYITHVCIHTCTCTFNMETTGCSNFSG